MFAIITAVVFSCNEVPTTLSPSDQLPYGAGDAESADISMGTGTNDANDSAAADTAVTPQTETVGGADSDTSCSCDDDNPCTIDKCLSDGGCKYLPSANPDCKPSLELYSPKYGTILTSDLTLDISGL
ncbi:MAG: hypothetical protein VX223_05160, partial [Myxococcota bacterium]|nr:hypothetical protein [Myxococcota bacterium]